MGNLDADLHDAVRYIPAPENLRGQPVNEGCSSLTCDSIQQRLSNSIQMCFTRQRFRSALSFMQWQDV
jgi:hypothetical protein